MEAKVFGPKGEKQEIESKNEWRVRSYRPEGHSLGRKNYPSIHLGSLAGLIIDVKQVNKRKTNFIHMEPHKI